MRAARSRDDILQCLSELNAEATRKKLSDYFGTALTAEQSWSKVISCLSANNEAFTHAVAEWGSRFIGHESTGNSPTLARRLALDLTGQEPPERVWTSRQHACFIFDGKSVILEDMNSLNGTFVNRQRVFPGQQRVLQPNDVVQIGTVQLRMLVSAETVTSG